MIVKLKKILVMVWEKIYESELFMSSIYYFNYRKQKISILSPLETIEYINKTNCSISRFGDGEFELLLQPNRNLGFQNYNENLSKKLLEVLSNDNKNLLICIPYTLNSIWGRTKHSRKFWFNWSKRNNQHSKIINTLHKSQKKYIYGDSQITRPYIAYKNRNHAKKIFFEIRKIWDNCDLLIIEGDKTRLGIGNDLFDNAKTIKRILCPSKNAFDSFEKIVSKVQEVYNGELIILALGPTATVMSSYLSNMNMRALDIGHIDIEYEWFKMRAKNNNEKINGKYTNEAENGDEVIDCNDNVYLEQIVSRVDC